MWLRSLQSASISAVPMQRRAGKYPITASTCILLAARSQWRLLTALTRWVLFPLVEALPRLVRSNQSVHGSTLPFHRPVLAPVGFRFQG